MEFGLKSATVCPLLQPISLNQRCGESCRDIPDSLVVDALASNAIAIASELGGRDFFEYGGWRVEEPVPNGNVSRN